MYVAGICEHAWRSIPWLQRLCLRRRSAKATRFRASWGCSRPQGRPERRPFLRKTVSKNMQGFNECSNNDDANNATAIFKTAFLAMTMPRKRVTLETHKVLQLVCKTLLFKLQRTVPWGLACLDVGWRSWQGACRGPQRDPVFLCYRTAPKPELCNAFCPCA